MLPQMIMADDEMDQEPGPMNGYQPPAYLPTPAEILRATREIRSEWDSFTEKQRRFGPSRIPWKVPQCNSHGQG